MMNLRVAMLVFGCLFSVETMAADKIKVVNEGVIGAAWGLPAGTQLAVPSYPIEYEREKAEVCVAIGYLLNADGTTSDFSLLKSWSARGQSSAGDEYWAAFAGASSDALAHWRFVPRPEITSPEPVYTVATFLFAPVDVEELRDKCAIPNVASRIFELSHNGRARRQMARIDVFKRLDLDAGME